MLPRAATSFSVINLGCKVNRVESDSIAAGLIERGWLAVDEEAADLIVVNTCTVTGEADKKARKAVRHALASNPSATVLVTGCAAAINPDVFLSLDPRVSIAGKREIEEKLSDGGQSRPVRAGEGFKTRVGLKVQDGCDHACTYCIVHVARGNARSISSERALAEARAYFESGVKEIVLTGIDIGAYREGSTRLPQLADALVREADRACIDSQGPARIRISSIEPPNVDDALIDALCAHEGRICRHLHVPLQSGSTKVLREMGRPYTAEAFHELMAKLRARIPSIALSTDVIVGFPGESDAEFEETCRLVREIGFMRLHVFPYSRREGTPAAARSDQVPAEVKRRRASQLRSLGIELAREDLQRRKGSTELGLVMDDRCLTESYHELAAPAGAQTGSLVPMTL